MEFLAVISHPAFWIVIAALEELIALSPLRQNSVLQVLLTAIRSIRPGGKK
jgi:hypothetical protein